MKNKFRVWHKKKAAWISDEVSLSMDADGNWLWDWIYEDMPPLNNDDIIAQQSTGLFDKNNKEIFEGDILFGETRNNPKIPTFTGIVEFHGPTASFFIRNGDGFTRGTNSLYNPGIVGNIYESNPIEVGARVMVMGGDPKIRGEVGVVSCFQEWGLEYCYVKINDKTYEVHYKDLIVVR